MKISSIVTYVGATAIAGLGVAMAVTNPSQPAYEEYAAQRLTEYLKKDVCTQVPKAFERLVQRKCGALVDSNHSQIQRIIAETTQRQNFIVFSVYRTDLSLNRFVPAYRFETIGVFQKFYTVAAEKQ